MSKRLFLTETDVTTSLVAKHTYFGMGEVHFGRTATHFVNIFVFEDFCQKLYD